MGKAFGWVPGCAHEWVNVTTMHDLAQGVHMYICTICEGAKEEMIAIMGDDDTATPEGWQTITTEIDTKEGYVRARVFDEATGKIIYSARYTPDVAKRFAAELTMAAYKIEDGA